MMTKDKKSTLIHDINIRIRDLNESDTPVIFFIAGNYSTGKTFFAKELIKNLDFYQTINFGTITKIIRFFKPEINMLPSNNKFFFKDEWKNLFNKILENLISSYFENGVNTIFEGVQVDTNFLLDNPKVTGGVILNTELSITYTRGKKPRSHFKRKINDLKNIEYKENDKFKFIDNNGTKENTFQEILYYLENLLEIKLKTSRLNTGF